jgi:myo-inositol-1(or 4)-monophosphatase
MAPDDLHTVALKAADAGAGAIRDKLRRPANTTAARRFVRDPAAALAEAERAIITVLGAVRCDDMIAMPGERSVRHGVTGIRWIVEPLGGRANLERGGNDYTVSLAALHRDTKVRAAAILRPGDSRWLATNEDGVAGSRSARVSTRATLGEAVIAVSFPNRAGARSAALRAFTELLPQVADVRRSGSPASDLLSTATGVIDAHVGFGLSAWDYLAGHALVTAAGGDARVLRMKRTPIVAIAGNAALTDYLEEALRIALAR